MVWQKIGINFAPTASDRRIYQADYYNLSIIISGEYRVEFHCGTQFRIRTMGILKEFVNP